MIVLCYNCPVGFWACRGHDRRRRSGSTVGEVLTAAAMKSIGDLDEIRAHPA